MGQFAQLYNRVIELWPLTQIRIEFLLNRLEINVWFLKEKFAYTLILTRLRLGLLCINLREFITKFWPLTHVRISNQPNILFNKILQIH